MLPPFSSQNPGTDAGVSDHKTLASTSQNRGTGVAKPRHGCHPNYEINNDRTVATTAETKDGGPRRANEALGPHPLGSLEPDLRQRLGERFRRLAAAALVARTADAVTLSVLTAAQRDAIRKHCEPDILAVAGASELRFEFAIAVEPPPLRKMP